jgi:HEAT repeat protein
MHHISSAPEIDQGMLVEVFKMLVCDWYLPARERALQALGWAGAAVCGQVYEDLRGAPDGWTRACAVTTLGFYGEEEHLRSARSDESMFVRAAADVALEMRNRRAPLRQLVELYQSEDNLVRLSAYFSIKHAGDEITLWNLDKAVDKRSFARIFFGELKGGVKARLKKDREERERKVKSYVNSDGDVRFDSPPF